MKEKNRIKLKKGLQDLPEYSPPDNIWESISNDLEEHPTDHVLQAALAELPSYEPPASIWSTIEESLEEAKVVSIHKAKKRARLTRWTIAASVAILVGLSGWFGLVGEEFNDEAIVTISHESKINFEGKRSEDHAGEMIGQVLAEVQSVAHTWEAPETVALRSSLNKIKASITEFQAAGEKFGMNQRMHEQLTDMYNKRNKIVRTLAGKI